MCAIQYLLQCDVQYSEVRHKGRRRRRRRRASRLLCGPLKDYFLQKIHQTSTPQQLYQSALHYAHYLCSTCWIHTTITLQSMVHYHYAGGLSHCCWFTITIFIDIYHGMDGLCGGSPPGDLAQVQSSRWVVSARYPVLRTSLSLLGERAQGQRRRRSLDAGASRP